MTASWVHEPWRSRLILSDITYGHPLLKPRLYRLPQACELWIKKEKHKRRLAVSRLLNRFPTSPPLLIVASLLLTRSQLNRTGNDGTVVSDIPDECVLVCSWNVRFLHLATTYWQFCTLCIWSLTQLHRIRPTAPFSYIYRTLVYIHAIFQGKKLNFSKSFRLDDGKKCQRPVKLFWGTPVLHRMSGFLHFFSFFMLYRMSEKSILPPKMMHFL